jgi:membrane-associated phospholipid phosphatase
LIGFSRIYLGVHYFSDVMGGFTLGIFWVMLLAWKIGISMEASPGRKQHE